MSGEQSNQSATQASIDITFVVACFNAAEYLELAVRSALAQEGVSVEVLIVDDGSTDASLEIAGRLCSEDPRVSLVKTTRNSGPGGARNLGIEAMRGRWYAVLDADDYILPERGKKLIATADRYGADMIADNLVEFGEGITPRRMFAIAPRGGAKKFDLIEYLQRSRLFGREPSPGYLKPMMRRAAIDRARLRYNAALRIGEDDDLVIKALNAGLKYVVCDFPGYHYRRHGSSISHRLSLANLEKMVEAEGQIAACLPSFILESPAYRGRRRALLRGHAFTRSVEALKKGSLVEAVLSLARRPGAIWFYSMPLAARCRRLHSRLNRLP